MKSSIMKHMKWLSLLLICSAIQLNAQVKVSFSDAGQTVNETDSLRIAIELSEASLLEVSVPYVISSESSVVLDSDYKIPEDNADNDFDNESPIVFAPGETKKYITIDLENDDEDENDEYLIVDLIADGLTVGVLGTQTRHTVRVLDNDTIHVSFLRHSGEVSEASNITVPIRLSSVSAQDVELSFDINLISANSSDVDLNDSFTTKSPVTFKAGTSSSSIAVKVKNDSVTDRNDGGADKETVEIRMTGAKLKDSGTSISFDDQPYLASIVDNDPLTLEFKYNDKVKQPFEVEEYQPAQVSISLVDKDGNESATGAEIEIPIAYSGTATRGNGDTDDYKSENDVVKIEAGKSTTNFTLLPNNDDIEEENETVTLTIGDAKYKDGGDLVIGEKNTMDFLIIDNDPITLNFGAIYSKDDEAAAEDPYDDIDNQLYIDSDGFIVPEAAGSISIPFYLSSVSSKNVEFDLIMNEDGTTATLMDSNKDSADQDWDYVVRNYNMQDFDKAVRVTIRAGIQAGTINLILNNDDEDPLPFGQTGAEGIESDESVRFSMANVNTDSSNVRLGEHSTFTLTIREMPEIDITSLVNGLSPSNGPVYNDATGLFEVGYNMNFSQVLNPMDFVGYNSIRVEYRTTNYDAANPEAEGNDPVEQNPFNPGEGKEFHYIVQAPYDLKFYSGTKTYKLIEGAEPVDGKYDTTTADTIENARFILKPVNLPRLNDFEAESTDGFELNDPLQWEVDFYSPGYFNMPLDRIDPAVNPNRMRVYLSVMNTPVLAGSDGTPLSIREIKPQEDGSMLLIINSNGAPGVQIQYMDAGSEWKIAQPAVITGGSTQMYWIDKGPPATESHPSTRNFRLYRATAISN